MSSVRRVATQAAVKRTSSKTKVRIDPTKNNRATITVKSGNRVQRFTVPRSPLVTKD